MFHGDPSDDRERRWLQTTATFSIFFCVVFFHESRSGGRLAATELGNKLMEGLEEGRRVGGTKRERDGQQLGVWREGRHSDGDAVL